MLKDRIGEGIFENRICTAKSEYGADSAYQNQYAYVIYDLNHNRNMKCIRGYFKEHEIVLNGRFWNFEYGNMDWVIRESMGKIRLGEKNNE